MNEKNTASVDDLIWAREMLRIFAKMEKALRKDLGKRGIDKIILKNPITLTILSLTTFVALIGVVFWFLEKDIIYLSALIFPSIHAFFILKNITIEKRKNIFRFIGKLNDPPESLIAIVEYYVFKQKEQLEEIIAWRINQADEKNLAKEQEKFMHMFEEKTWEGLDTAQQQCTILAVLMVTLQKFLHNNRDIYNEHVKKLPLMNHGYNYKPTKQKKPLEAEDIQTFDVGFQTDDLFHK